MKYKVLKDYQHITEDKKVIQIKPKLVIIDYKVTIKGDIYRLDKDIVDNNPEFFHQITWKEDLLDYIKASKLPTPAIITKKLVPYIEENYLSNTQVETKIVEKVVEKVIQADNSMIELEISKRQILLDELSSKLSSREDEIEQKEKLLKEAIAHNDQRDKSLDFSERELITKKLEVQKLDKILTEREGLFTARSKSEQEYQNILNEKIQEYEDKLSQVDEQLELYKIDKPLNLDEFKSLLLLAGDKYHTTRDEYWRNLVNKTGWHFNTNGLFR